jgi:hypothetical protein
MHQNQQETMPNRVFGREGKRSFKEIFRKFNENLQRNFH